MQSGNSGAVIKKIQDDFFHNEVPVWIMDKEAEDWTWQTFSKGQMANILVCADCMIYATTPLWYCGGKAAIDNTYMNENDCVIYKYTWQRDPTYCGSIVYKTWFKQRKKKRYKKRLNIRGINRLKLLKSLRIEAESKFYGRNGTKHVRIKIVYETNL